MNGHKVSFRRRVRRHLGRGLRAFERLACGLLERFAGNSGNPIPPAHLRRLYYRTYAVARFRQACHEAVTELTNYGLRRDSSVLDIGSGIGNLPIGLVGRYEGQYVGLEISREAVTWCQKAITPRYPNFRFVHADIYSEAYNPRGTVSDSEFRFPAEDGAFDFVLLSSVFTHMLPEGVTHYAKEIRRVLKDSGVCVASIFLVTEERQASLADGRSFITFKVPHASGVCLLHDPAVPEAAVAFDEGFLRETFTDAGLSIRAVRQGTWWQGGAHDQDVLAMSPARPSVV